MNGPNDFVFLLPLFMAVFVLVGVVAASHYRDRPFAVPLARLTLLALAGFMLLVALISHNIGALDFNTAKGWAMSGFFGVCVLIFAPAALFARGETILWWIDQLRRGMG